MVCLGVDTIDTFLSSLLPAALSPFDFWLLVVSSLFTSAITAAFGVGGGATLLALMANILPASAVIPVHGVVQLGSNTGRIITMRKYIRWRMAGWFIGGCVIGSAVGGQIAISLPTDWLQIILGGFILVMCWEPFKIKAIRDGSSLLLGSVTSFISMFVGVTGIFVISTLKHVIEDRREVIGTLSAMMGFQHLMKCIVFLALGFAFHEWVWLMVLMVGFGFVGTLIGRTILNKMSNKGFGITVKIVITVLALRLLYKGFSGLLAG